MEFLYPQFLWALSAIGVPIVIHLFNFRKYKTILFSDVSLLKDIKQQTNKQRQLKHWIVLLLRILFICSLVVAFAQPYIPSQEGFDQQRVGVYIDNSQSMLARSSKGENFNFSKLSAKEVIESYPSGTMFRLYTNQLLSRHNLWLRSEQILNEINDLETSIRSTTPDVILQKFISDVENNPSRLFLISDFQESQFSNLKNLDFDKLSIVQMPVSGVSSNVSVDTVWVNNPVSMIGFEQRIQVVIKNYGLEDVSDNLVTFDIDNKIVGSQTVDLSANQSKTIEFVFNPNSVGSKKAKIAIEGPDFYFDDQLYFTLNVQEKRKVVSIQDSEANAELKNIFKDDYTEYIELSYNRLDPNVLDRGDLLVLDHLQEITLDIIRSVVDHLDKGKNVLVVPGFDINIKSYNLLFNEIGVSNFREIKKGEFQINQLNYLDPYFSSAFQKEPKSITITGVSAFYPIDSRSRLSRFELVKLNIGQPLSSRYLYKESNCIVLNSGLSKEFGSWYKSDMALPLIYQSLIYKQDKKGVYANAQSNSYWSSEIKTVEKNPVKVIGRNEFIPEQKQSDGKLLIRIGENFDKSGVYPVILDNDTLDYISINSGRYESSVSFLSAETLKSFNENWQYIESGKTDVSSQVSDIINSKQYWKQFLLLGLFFLLMEVLVLRFWKSK